MEQYPTLSLIVRHGRWIARLVAILPVLAVTAGVVLWSWPALLIIAAVIAALVLLLLMQSYVEIVHAVADALIPK